MATEEVNESEVSQELSQGKEKTAVAKRFRGFLPVIVDIETAGFNAATDAMLEIAAVTVTVNDEQQWCIDDVVSKHVNPFEGANLDQASLEFTGIDPDHPFRKQIAVNEVEALSEIFKPVRKKIKQHRCSRAILVGHNASFDLGFLNACVERNNLKRNPFHPFSTFDTATMAGLAYGIAASVYPSALSIFIGPDGHGRNVGILLTAWGAAGLIGPLLAGYFFDITSDYRIPIEFACVASILALFNAMRLPRTNAIQA